MVNIDLYWVFSTLPGKFPSRYSFPDYAVDGWKDGRTEGWKDGCIDGLMD